MTLYTISLNLELDEPTGIYTVTSPDVPGLITEGRTPAEITQNVQEAIDCLLEGWHRRGLPVPAALREPTTLPKQIKTLVLA